MAGRKIKLLKQYYEEKIYNLTQLLEISKSLNSTLDYETITESILYTIMGQLRVANAALFTKKRLDSHLFCLDRNYKGFELTSGIEYCVKDNSKAIELMALESRCWSPSEIIEKLGNLGGLENINTLNPCLYVPLKEKNHLIGIIILGDRILGDSISIAEQQFLLTIALFAAVAINNATLFELTTTDRMTGLRLKHYFYTVLQKKMEESAFTNKPLSVIMADIDFFKKFNDTYGHNCGDEILKRVAENILLYVRQSDVAARYGGEEFCVFFPDTDARETFNIAERIRDSIQKDIMDYEGTPVSVTISFGIAQYDPSRDISVTSLVERADHALYASKEAGRNCTNIDK